MLISIFFGCGDGGIDGVKKGVMTKYSNNLTVGQALESWSKTQKCTKVKWESFTTERGEKMVNFTCTVQGEAQLASMGLDETEILKSGYGIKDVQSVYADLEALMDGYDEQKKQLIQEIPQRKEVLVNLNSQLSKVKEEIEILEKETQKARAECQQSEEEARAISSPRVSVHSEEYKNYEKKWKEAYDRAGLICSKSRDKDQEKQSKINKLSPIQLEKDIESLEHQIKRIEDNAKSEIASMDRMIANGKEKIQTIDSLNEAITQLDKIDMIVQFALSVDGKSFQAKYNGIKYFFKDTKTYKESANILLNAYGNEVYNIGYGFRLENYQGRK
jgi:DNA repair exonuclease SbcCD ATPase subunit